MDELAEALDASADISNTPNSTARPHPKYGQFRQTNFGDQEKRRQELLEHQKKKRQELFSVARGLGTKLKKDEAVEALNKAAEEAERAVREAEAMEVVPPAQEERVYQYRDQLMLSEWLVTVPPTEELASDWFMVPCPQGRRTLIVASKGRTQAFSKAGHPTTSSFPSLLPGGSTGGPRKLSTVLDCIWNYENSCYYILDVLAWSNQPLLDCDTEFRFYWLKTKLEETPALGETSPDHRYKFSALPHYKCTRENMTKVMSTYPLFPGGSPNLDGLLFYHRETQYVHGTTPLVGWLKPYMLPDILDIPVAPAYEDMRPAGYETLEKHIEKTYESHINRPKWRGRGRGRYRGRGRGGRGHDVTMHDGDTQQMDTGSIGNHPVM